MPQSSPDYKVGDIIFDSLNKEIGVLLRRYNLFEEGYYGTDEEVVTMVWDIFWSGPKMDANEERYQTYTEEGIDILFSSGVLELYSGT